MYCGCVAVQKSEVRSSATFSPAHFLNATRTLTGYSERARLFNRSLVPRPFRIQFLIAFCSFSVYKSDQKLEAGKNEATSTEPVSDRGLSCV